VISIACCPVTSAVNSITCSCPGVDQGPPKLFHCPDPLRENDVDAGHPFHTIASSHGSDAGEPPDSKVPLRVIQEN